MIPKLGFSLQANYDRPIAQVISLLKGAGFSAVSPVWDAGLDLAALEASVHAEGMEIQSLHAPHKDIAALWEPESEKAQLVCRNLLQCLQDCRQYHIPVLVVHCWQGHQYTFRESSLDFRAFDEIVSTAGKLGVCIALENLEGEEYLATLMDRYRDLHQIGFCWDTGHDHCYPHKTDFCAAYGDRLMMTHLNDNLGLRDPGGVPSVLDDLHFLPGDGNVDWESALQKLARMPEQKILNFEIKKVSKSKDPKDLLYEKMPLEVFFAEAGKRGFKITQMYAMIREKKV